MTTIDFKKIWIKIFNISINLLGYANKILDSHNDETSLRIEAIAVKSFENIWKIISLHTLDKNKVFFRLGCMKMRGLTKFLFYWILNTGNIHITKLNLCTFCTIFIHIRKIMTVYWNCTILNGGQPQTKKILQVIL